MRYPIAPRARMRYPRAKSTKAVPARKRTELETVEWGAFADNSGKLAENSRIHLTVVLTGCYKRGECFGKWDALRAIANVRDYASDY